MELYQFLFQKKHEDETFTQRNFAKKVGMTHQRLCAIAHYRVKPSDEVAMKLEKATGGQVDAWELLKKAIEFKNKKKKQSRK